MGKEWDEILPDPEDENLFDDYNVLPEFKRDFKKLVKKWRSLGDDLQRFIEYQLKLFHLLDTDNGGTVELTYVDPEECNVFKSDKFACMDLGGGSQSGIRVIHAYYKGDKKNEDRDRVRRYYE